MERHSSPVERGDPFGMRAHGTTPRTEMMAGFATYLTMAYIVAVNPGIMEAAGIDRGAAFVATCLAAAIGSALMGLLANFPIALAPGMGLNAYFAFAVVQGAGVPWQVALGAVFVGGMVSSPSRCCASANGW
jgi:adenine/guanine/hypoxanthine permease